MVRWILAAVLGVGLCVAKVDAHPGHGPIADWVLVPEHPMPGAAGARPGARPEQPRPALEPLSTDTAPIVLFGEQPTERRTHLIGADALQLTAATVELWILDHVNQPVGVLAAVRDRAADGEPVLALAYHNSRLFTTARRAGMADASINVSQLGRQKGYKKWWHHVVATHDGRTLRLYHNGKLAGELEVGALLASGATQPDFELAAYTGNEPYMGLEHLVRAVRVWDDALDADTIAARYAELCQQVDAGILQPGVFHLTAGPYLHMVTPNSINLAWETARPGKATIRYGTGPDLNCTVEVLPEPDQRVHTLTLGDLQPDTAYMYRLEIEAEDGARIDSGLLSFHTAPAGPRPVRFVVMGDPEARPHINHRIGSLAWNERPEFIVNLGDLTDGGEEPNKFEWTHEYFVGMGAIAGRVPSFTVPGNGEGDLYWYSYYHDYPSPDPKEGYYTFTYADTQFFMLDSNRRGDDFKPGGAQFEWLKEQLAASTATWKFVCHHHPTYSSDDDDFGDTWKGEPTSQGDPRVQRMLDLYESGGVDIVFFGHLHSYERSLPVRNGRFEAGGVVHVQAGGGGGNLEDFAPNSTWFSGKTHRGHHFVSVSIVEARLELRMYNDQGAMLDLFVLEK